VSVGERGPSGDHGQMGDTGARGAKGEKGERGVNPWVVRRANVAYGLLACGLFLFAALSQYQERQNDERAAEVLARFEAGAVATDKAFCALSVQSRTAINANRDAIRAMEAAVRASFELVAPAPDATAAQRARTLEFRRQILAQLDGVKVDGNLALPDCSGIGNSQLDSSLQEAVTNGGTTPPTTTTTTRSTP
jgi:hypothetical protein